MSTATVPRATGYPVPASGAALNSEPVRTQLVNIVDFLEGGNIAQGNIDVTEVAALAVANTWTANQTYSATLTVGADDTGYNVQFFGATSGKSMLWDESADKLIITGDLSVSGTVSDLGTVTTADIDGGTIDGVIIGGSSAAAGTFTTLTSSSTTDLGATTVDSLSVSDGNITNVGDIALDSISGDADSNTTITFAGSDVIVVATGGSEAFRVDASQRVLIGGHTTGVSNTQLHVETSGVTRSRIESTSTTSSISMDMVAPASNTSQIQLRWLQGDGSGSANNEGYVEYYDGNNGRLALNGASAGADIWRIPDGQTSIDANTTWDDNAFDYVCESCGWHNLNQPEGAECPECGGHVEWHDDNALIFDVVSTTEHREEGLARLAKLGVVNRYDDGDFVCLQPSIKYTWSAMSQMFQLLKNQQSEIAQLKMRMV